MIKELTKEQEILLKDWHDKWLNIGLSCDPTDEKTASEAIKKAYVLIGKKEPQIVFCDSPLSCNVMIHLLSKEKDSLWNSLRGSFRDSLGDWLWNSLRGSLEDSLEDSLRGSLGGSLGEINIQHTYLWGQMDAYWISYYLFCQEIGVVYKKEEIEKLNIMADLCKSCGWWYPYEGMCFVSRRPKSISMEDKVLHCDGGPSVEFHDGFKIHSLNGIRVPEWVAVTPYEELDIKKILKIENADVKAQALKRYGPERLIDQGYGKVIDDKWTESKYKLIDLSELFETYEYAPHLYMENPSIPGLIHCEGVPPEIRSVEEALKWREDRLNEAFNKVIHT